MTRQNDLCWSSLGHGASQAQKGSWEAFRTFLLTCPTPGQGQCGASLALGDRHSWVGRRCVCENTVRLYRTQSWICTSGQRFIDFTVTTRKRSQSCALPQKYYLSMILLSPDFPEALDHRSWPKLSQDSAFLKSLS